MKCRAIGQLYYLSFDSLAPAFLHADDYSFPNWSSALTATLFCVLILLFAAKEGLIYLYSILEISRLLVIPCLSNSVGKETTPFSE